MDEQRKDDLKFATDIDTTPPNITINPLGNRAPEETKDWESRSFRYAFKALDVPAKYIHGKLELQVARPSTVG